MNEHIDILLTTAKMATRNNPWAHLTTQAVSMGYNASMLWYYSNQLGMANAINPGYLTAEMVQAYKQERIKHTILLSLTCCGLFLAAASSFRDRR